ncbi:MAG: DUF962 domain-containing protein [Phycisphaerales bacterium]|nr:DUF962 domain-containing protein [Phycisphaerales bacterium]
MPGWWKRYLQRHCHPVSRWLHLIGVPLTLVALGLFIAGSLRDCWSDWWRPTVLLVVGYVLQWVGHRIEGNDMGEIILIKKCLGRPFVAIAPRYAQLRSPTDNKQT